MSNIKRNRSGEHEQRKQKCIQLKICLRCSSPKSPNEGLVCEECLKKRRLKRKKQYAQKESKNLCRCGRQREKDKKLCGDCAKNGRNSAATQRAKHTNAGKCITCGKPPVPGLATCKACSERAATSTIKRYETNKKQGVCPFCGKELDDKFRCDNCHSNHLKNGKLQWHKKHRLILKHYGEICKCCDETIFEFLEIDHINGGGTKHRKEIGSHYFDWIVKEDFPDIFQTLCANCNRGKSKFGICPHEQTPDPNLNTYRWRRLKCITEYGGKCQNCGEDNWAFLEFDHTNNDGNEHRKTVKNIIQWIIRNNFPDTIQLLCSNCNKAKQQYPDWYKSHSLK